MPQDTFHKGNNQKGYRADVYCWSWFVIKQVFLKDFDASTGANFRLAFGAALVHNFRRNALEVCDYIQPRPEVWRDYSNLALVGARAPKMTATSASQSVGTSSDIIIRGEK